jgi:hypothetical protein
MSDMKTIQISLLSILLYTMPALYAQQTGTVEGRLVNLTDPSIVPAGVELEVLSLGGGMSIIKSGKTDASGKFRIDGLPEDQRLMVRANYKGANYHVQLTFKAGAAKIDLGIYEPTTSMKGIEIEADRMAFQVTGDQLKLLETVTINNKTNPPKTFTSPEGNFRVSKAPGLLEPPQMRVTAPGSSMPLVQSALESADGSSYYSLYPLRPGVTTFEVQQLLPYRNKGYTYVKRFYQDVRTMDIGVIPQDVALSGSGLSKIQTDPQRNFSVYSSTPVKAGTEVAWSFSGGTAVPETPAAPETTTGQPEVTTMQNAVGRNTLIIGPLLMMGLVLVLWFAFNRPQEGTAGASDYRVRQIRQEREQLLNSIVELDRRYETQSLEKEEFLRQREESKRRLRRISLLLKKQ